MIWFSVSCPSTWQCRNPSGYVAELQKLTAAAVASMSTEVDTHCGGGVGLLHWKESDGALPQFSARNQRESTLLCATTGKQFAPLDTCFGGLSINPSGWR